MIAAAAGEVGLERLTMRSVADRLGVSVPGLYHYVSGRDDLLRLASEQTAARFKSPEDHGQHWAEWLFEWAEHARAGFTAAPELLEQFLHGGVGFDRMFDHVDSALGLLLRAGFTHAEARDAHTLVNECALGAAVAEIRHAEANRTGHPISVELHRHLAQRRPDELLSLRGLVASNPREQSFQQQVCTVLVGIAVRRGEPWDEVAALIEQKT